jgi:hypothetical protein
MLLEQHKLALYVYEKLEKVLQDFRKQLVEITASYYIRLARVTSTLIASFRENRDVLASEKILESEKSFAVPMMTIAELKKPLDAEIERLNIPGLLDAFMTLLLDHESAWITEDENKITRLVTDFLVQTAFKDFSSRTITSFLKDKYNIDNDEALAEKIYREWMCLLTAKARPLFYFDNHIWEESRASTLAYLSFPVTSQAIRAAAGKMHEVGDQRGIQWSLKPSSLTDRIYVMCSASALPLCAYNNCGEYEREFFSTNDAGRHYYEGKSAPGMAFNDWNQLPSLTPQSVIDLETAPEKMRQMVLDGRALYEDASAHGIFDDQSVICQPDPAAVESLKALTESCRQTAAGLKKPEDLPAAEELLGRIKAAEPLPMTPTEMRMRHDGYAAEKKDWLSVQEDYFVAAPAYRIAVQKILSDMDAVTGPARKAENLLAEQITKIGSGGRDIDDFCDALFTGIITMEGYVVTYRRVEHGIDRSIELSRRGPEYPMGAIPVYQAFCSYQALDGDIRGEVRQAVDTRYNSGAPEIRESGEKMKEALSDNQITAWVRVAGTLRQQSEIVDFLEQLKQRLDTFCLANGL